MAKILKKQKQPTNQLNAFLNKNYKLFSLLIMVGILLLGYFFLVGPKIKTLNDYKNNQLANKQAELKILEDYSIKMSALENLIEQYKISHQQDLNLLLQALPDKAQLPELIAQLDALVRASGFQLANLSFTEKTYQDTLNKVAREILPEEIQSETANALPDNLMVVEIVVNLKSADYPAFKNLLNNLERHIRLFDLISVNFAPASDAGAGSGFTLALRTYYLNQ